MKAETLIRALYGNQENKPECIIRDNQPGKAEQTNFEVIDERFAIKGKICKLLTPDAWFT